MQKYITTQGLNQSITDNISITDRLILYKHHKRWLMDTYWKIIPTTKPILAKEIYKIK